MPIVRSREATGKLSPLEEEEGQESGESLGVMVDRSRVATEVTGVGVSVFTSLGTLVLTARPYLPASSRCGGGSRVGERGGRGGRGEDSHGATLQGEIFQTVSKESLLVMQEHMEKLWCERIPMCIEVKGQATPSSNDSSLLLEQWLVQVLPRRSNTAPIPPSFLTHAVKSFLHFSQIRSWIVSHKGSLPFNLTYRVCAPGEDTSDTFSSHTPQLHIFPPSPLSPLSSLQVSVRYLPRLKHVPRQLMLTDNIPDIVSNFRDLSLSKSAERLKDLVVRPSECLQEPIASISKSAECIKDLVPMPVAVSRTKSSLLSKSAERMKEFSTRSSSRVVTPPHLMREPPSLYTLSPQSPGSSCHSHTPSPRHSSHLHTMVQDSFPFSPPKPSPMSPKLLAGLGEPLHYHSLLERNRLDSDTSGISNGKGTHEGGVYSSERSCQNFEGQNQQRGGNYSCVGSFSFNSACVRGGGGDWEEGVVWEGEKKRANEVVDKTVKCGTVRSPAASSPIPFMRRTMSESKHQHKRSSAINIKGIRPPRPLRSNSAPAIMHSLSLLGTFEESVLNGRLEPCGFVEGFTAELGASGSFCPRHITLPVTAAFFNLSDSGTSPYLGVIDLSTTGKRGYHVAKKGTVQLTLFNPNGTVVKIFVVTYDFLDMPPNSQTFLRQKTISPPLSHLTPATLHSPPLLHYLIHLRFLCSKSGRVYLHKDIRLIFARRAPDTEPDFSRVTLTTITEGPPSPKYGPLDGQSDRAKSNRAICV